MRTTILPLFSAILLPAAYASGLFEDDPTLSESLEARDAHPVAIPDPFIPMIAGAAVRMGAKVAAKRIAKKVAQKAAKKVAQKATRKTAQKAAQKVEKKAMKKATKKASRKASQEGQEQTMDAGMQQSQQGAPQQALEQMADPGTQQPLYQRRGLTVRDVEWLELLLGEGEFA